MTHVYVLSIETAHEAGETIGVYSTQDKAKQQGQWLCETKAGHVVPELEWRDSWWGDQEAIVASTVRHFADELQILKVELDALAHSNTWDIAVVRPKVTEPQQSPCGHERFGTKCILPVHGRETLHKAPGIQWSEPSK